MLSRLFRAISSVSAQQSHFVHNIGLKFAPSLQAAAVGHLRPLPMRLPARALVSSSSPCRMPLDEFRDSVSRQTRVSQPVGRSWSVRELRLKSYQDMQKLWYVLHELSSSLCYYR
jgi:hypothetical protein